MSDRIAIVGMACRYPDARTPAELWENVLAKRQAFRRFPAGRLRLEDYYSADHSKPDRTYSCRAALIEEYWFDRLRFRVSGDAFRSADLAHWLALDVASQALADAGFFDGRGLPREKTAVLVGNTLTGEFSRANLMRLRWPYVRRVVEDVLAGEGIESNRRRVFLEKLEDAYKKPFPIPGEETLAGALSNTIAGRICNHFDLKGGGYTIDGACASSLLAVITACQSLLGGDVEVALAGGVDLSLDPFELIGFAKAGALATDEMLIYDRRPTGFLPGEGCGFVVLMKLEQAIAQSRRVYAVIRGWGLSSDGSGGITRPEIEGQLLALRRAYCRAGFAADTVSYYEGHGTGTSAGDTVELHALTQVRREAFPDSSPAVIGSVKANIGHTKAAAGVAGLIKTALALHTQILPPTSGCIQPHAVLSDERPALQVLELGRPWPANRPLRAGVSAMGFGGINTHLVLEGPGAERRDALDTCEQTLLHSSQDAELFLLSAVSHRCLAEQINRLLALVPGLSRSELSDLAAHLGTEIGPGQVRLALVASNPESLVAQLRTARLWVCKGENTRIDTKEAIFLAQPVARPRVGFLFPGQGAPVYSGSGALGNRFVFRTAWDEFPSEARELTTAVAQSAIICASLTGLRVLNHLGLEADLAIGHSLGELTALHWAGAISEGSLVRIAQERGTATAKVSEGAMATIGAGRPEVDALLNGDPVVIACLNSPRQTVIAGDRAAVASVLRRAQQRGLHSFELPVRGAFHSPLLASAIPALERALAQEPLQRPHRTVLSTVTGTILEPEVDLRQLLCRQLTSPVRFIEAITAAGRVDLWIEVGPGRILSGMLPELSPSPTIPLDAGGPSVTGLLEAVGAAFVLGASVNHGALFDDRFHRPFDLDHPLVFFQNPCEQAPVLVDESSEAETNLHEESRGGLPMATLPSAGPMADVKSSLELIKQLIGERAELPPSSIRESDHLLKDLHLNSIAVGQLVIEAARRLGLPPPVAPTDYSDASVGEVARALDDRVRLGGPVATGEERFPPGVDSWIQAFTVDLREVPLPSPRRMSGSGDWEVFSPPAHVVGESVKRIFRSQGEGDGVIVCLPSEPDDLSIGMLLAGARAALAKKGTSHFVLVQHGWGAAALARTLYLESPSVTTCVVDVPLESPNVAAWVLAEARSAVGFVEAHYDADGRRREPVLRLLPMEPIAACSALEEKDVVLVTGGGKGITAECVLALARQTGASFALVGRTRPETDHELAANLERMSAAGIHCQYHLCDISHAEAVRNLVGDVEQALGPITVLLHGAAVNVPTLLTSLEESTFREALGLKVQGLRNLLSAVHPERLHLLVTFGSLLARTGMRGEAHYAVANEWLTYLTELWQTEHPHCRCLAVEWSIWSGAGMGQRLGGLDALIRRGITPIPVEAGVQTLSRLLAQKAHPPAIIVTSRFGEFPTLRPEPRELPLRRFLERPLIYYPEVELVSEADLSPDTDPYLEDHVFRGDRLFPAAMGLEAMVQVAQVLAPCDGPLVLEHVQFSHPVVVAGAGPVTIRLAALCRESGEVEVVLRCSATGFQKDHFRAICRSGGPQSDAHQPSPMRFEGETRSDLLPLDPERDLYGKLLFQGGRFRRLKAFRQLRARQCCAEIMYQEQVNWFSPYLPPHLVLGDPGVRDAAMHAIQSCIPHVTLLPLGLERVTLRQTEPPGLRLVHAQERSHEGKIFVYDVEILTPNGQLQERWEGLRLRGVAEGMQPKDEWPAVLIGPYLERRLQELSSSSDIAVALEEKAGRSHRRGRVMRRVLETTMLVHHRPDGKPVTADDRIGISVAHTADLTLAVAGTGRQGCDLEQVVARPATVWRDLLGPGGYRLATLIARENGEDEATAATRVWAAIECLKKAGVSVDVALILDGVAEAGCITLACGRAVVATLLVHVRGVHAPVVAAALVGDGHGSL